MPETKSPLKKGLKLQLLGTLRAFDWLELKEICESLNGFLVQ